MSDLDLQSLRIVRAIADTGSITGAADALGYSHHVAFLPAEKSAEPWARYAARHAGDQR